MTIFYYRDVKENGQGVYMLLLYKYKTKKELPDGPHSLYFYLF